MGRDWNCSAGTPDDERWDAWAYAPAPGAERPSDGPAPQESPPAPQAPDRWTEDPSGEDR